MATKQEIATIMNFADTLVDFCIQLENSILTMVKRQREWEIALQHRICDCLEENGITQLPDRSYTNTPGKKDREVDFHVLFNGVHCVVELKVESAKNPNRIGDSNLLSTQRGKIGAGFVALEKDSDKVSNFHRNPLKTDSIGRLVLFVGYSQVVVERVKEIDEHFRKMGDISRFREGRKICALAVADGPTIFDDIEVDLSSLRALGI